MLPDNNLYLSFLNIISEESTVTTASVLTTDQTTNRTEYLSIMIAVPLAVFVFLSSIIALLIWKLGIGRPKLLADTSNASVSAVSSGYRDADPYPYADLESIHSTIGQCSERYVSWDSSYTLSDNASYLGSHDGTSNGYLRAECGHLNGPPLVYGNQGHLDQNQNASGEEASGYLQSQCC